MRPKRTTLSSQIRQFRNAAQTSLLRNFGGSTNITPLSPRDVWSANTGVNYKANDRWQLRGGFWYEPSVLPESDFSPALMDQTRYGVSSGAGYAFTHNLSLDVSYTAVFFHNRIINNSVGTNSSGIPAGGVPPVIPSADISGTYKDFANLVALNVNYKFGTGK